jgi:hypothetical protein
MAVPAACTLLSVSVKKTVIPALAFFQAFHTSEKIINCTHVTPCTEQHAHGDDCLMLSVKYASERHLCTQTENFREALGGQHSLPGVFFFYDLSPIKVRGRGHTACGKEGGIYERLGERGQVCFC